MTRNLKVQVDDIHAINLSGVASPHITPGSRTSARRGGYGYSGTMGSNGELPIAPELFLESERQLPEEIREISEALNPKSGWERRVTALLKLEGLVKGGAASSFASFNDLACSLHAELTPQLQDRRSAVSRQACHVISVLVQACGIKIEPLVVSLQPALLRAPAMSITIVTEAAAACVRTIIRCCPTSRLLPPLCSMVRTDKNAKLRQSAAEYVLQVLQEWAPGEYDRYAEMVESAILAASQDAALETREIGRDAFAAYFSKCPSEAQSMLARLPDTEHSLKDKLLGAVNASLGRGGAAFRSDATITVKSLHVRDRPNSSRSSCPSREALISLEGKKSPSPVGPPQTMMKRGAVRIPKLTMPSPILQEKRDSADPSHTFLSARAYLSSPSTELPPRPASAQSSPAGPPSWSLAAPAPPLSKHPQQPILKQHSSDQIRPFSRAITRPAGRARRSFGGAALRVAATTSLIHADHTEAGDEMPQALEQCHAIEGHKISESFQASSYSSSSVHMNTSSLPPRRAPAGNITSLRETASAMQDETTSISISAALMMLSKQGLLWSTKISLFDTIRAALEEGIAHEDAENADLVAKLVHTLVDGAGDAHFKVATAALHATVAALHARELTQTLQFYLEDIVPSLFARVVDAKEQIRHLVGAAVSGLSQVFDPEAVMQGLAASMHMARAPKVLCAIMNFYSEFTQRFTAVGAKKRNPAFSAGGRSVLASCMALATNKNPDVRQSAIHGISVVYSSASNTLVESLLLALPASPQQAIAQALSQVLENQSQSPSPGRVRSDFRVQKVVPPGHGDHAGLMSPSSPPSLPSLSPYSKDAFIASSDAAAFGAGSPTAQRRSHSMTRSQPPPPWDSSFAGTGGPGVDEASPVYDMYHPESTSITRISSRAVADDVVADVHTRKKTPITMSPSTISKAPTPSVTISVDATFNAQQCFTIEPEPCTPPSVSPLRVTAVSTYKTQQHTWSVLLEELREKPTIQVMNAVACMEPQLNEAPEKQKILAIAVCEGLLQALHQGSTDLTLQEACMECFSQCARSCLDPEDASRFARRLLEGLIFASAHENEAVVIAAERATKELLEAMDAVEALSLVIAHLPSAHSRPPFDGEAAKQASVVLKALRIAAGRVTLDELRAVLDRVMPSLCSCYTSPNAVIRKRVVDCIVSFHQALGKDDVEAHLQQLSVAQRKLISIYVDKAQGKIP